MKIGVIGLGKLGFPFALVLARAGHQVIGYDHDGSRMSLEAPLGREAGVAEAIQQVRDDGLSLSFRAMEHIAGECELVFFCVQTPHAPKFGGDKPLLDERKDFDYSYLKASIEEYLGWSHHDGTTLVVVSTVLPGTCAREITPLLKHTKTRFAYAPQFIAMGTVIRDFEQSREPWLIGTDDIGGASEIEAVFRSISKRFIKIMSVASAEAAKVLYNTWITSKVTLANTAALVCDAIEGADVGEVTAFLKICHERLCSDRYMNAGMGDGGACLPSGQIVVTQNGPRAIETIEAGDRVLTRSGQLKPVIRKWERDYEGDILEITAEGMPPARVTTDHPMLRRIDGRSFVPDGRRNTLQHAVDLLGMEHEIVANSLELGDFLPWPVPHEHVVTVPPHVNAEYLELAGWYLSEGSIEFTNRNGRIAFALHRKERPVAERLCYLLTKLSPPKTSGRGAGARTVITERGENGLIVRYGSKALSKILITDFGSGAANKLVPDWIIYGPQWIARALMKGMWQGDGHSSSLGGFMFSTISENMAHGMFLMLARENIPATMRDIPPRVSLKGQAHQRSFEVRVRNARFYDRMAEITGMPRPQHKDQKLYTRFPESSGAFHRKVIRMERTQYCGKVWNLWVDDDHTFVTTLGAVHNCHPRDNIALSWLARQYKLPYDAFGFLMEAREKHAQALAERLKAIASDGMQHVILGTAFKPDSDLESGSHALLTACYLDDPILLDPIVPARAREWHKQLLRIKGPCAVLIACDHSDPQFADLRWLPNGSSFLIPFMENRTRRQFPKNALVEYFGRRG